MVRSHLSSAALCLSWALSTDVLVRLGQGLGANRTLQLAALGVAALLSALAVALIRHPILRRHGVAGPTGLLLQAFGAFPTATLLLASRTSLAILLPTGLLVTAGFAFNEIFLYWFPNFGFSFLLLAGITLLHLLGDAVVRATQLVFIGTAMGALLVLCLAGISGPISSSPVSVDTAFSLSPVLLGSAMLLLLGYDFPNSAPAGDSRLPPFGALFFALALLLFWSMLTLQYVPKEQLLTSTIPHMLTAKAMAGETGRMLMGIAVIAGTCGAVNGLFQLALATFHELATRHLLPGHPPQHLRRGRYVLLLAAIIAGLLAGGLAGQPVLELYIESALLLWLAVVGFCCLAAGLLLHGYATAWSRAGLALGSGLCLLAVGLLAGHDEPMVIGRFLTILLAGTAGAVILWLRLRPAVEIMQLHPHQGGTHS